MKYFECDSRLTRESVLNATEKRNHFSTNYYQNTKFIISFDTIREMKIKYSSEERRFQCFRQMVMIFVATYERQ